MSFDVRLPIGLLFLAIGVIVGTCGLFGDAKMFEARSAGINIDLVWGGVMAGFGAVMLILALFAARRQPKA